MESNLEAIVRLKAFDRFFKSMYEKNPAGAENIETSIKAVVKKFHDILCIEKYDDLIYEITLLKEKIAVEVCRSQYTELISKLANYEHGLKGKASRINEIFFDVLFSRLDVYFANKKQVMSIDIDKQLEWYTGIADTAKKGGDLINKGIKQINVIAKNFTGNSKTIDVGEINSRTLLESVLEKHFNNKEVGMAIGKIMEEAFLKYKETWMNVINEQVPEFTKSDYFFMDKNVNVKFQLGASEQTMLMGLGSAVVGTLGLAAGWHTITYAILNVFPPVAIFTALATVITGILTKDKAKDAKKKQLEEMVNQYYRVFISEIETRRIEELSNRTLRKHISYISETIINSVADKMKQMILGAFTIEDYKLLESAFNTHLLLIEGELAKLQNELC